MEQSCLVHGDGKAEQRNSARKEGQGSRYKPKSHIHYLHICTLKCALLVLGSSQASQVLTSLTTARSVYCYNRIPKTGWPQRETFISHSFKGQEEQGAFRSTVRWGPASWFTDGHLLSVYCIPENKDSSLLPCTVRPWIPFMRDLPSGFNYVPKALLPNFITLGI